MIADVLDKLSAPSSSSLSSSVKVNGNATMKPGIGGEVGVGNAKGGQQQQQHPTTNQMKSMPFMMNRPAAVAVNAQNTDANQPQTVQPNVNNNNNLKNNNNDNSARLVKYLVSSTTSRYSRPGLPSILVQVAINAIGGHIFARSFVLPHLGIIIDIEDMHDTVAVIIVLSCLLVPVFELFSSINEAELHYSHYSLVASTNGIGGRKTQFQLWPVLFALTKDIGYRVKNSIVGVTMMAPVIATATILIWSHMGTLIMGDDGLFILDLPSYAAIIQSVFISYITVALLVIIVAIQDVLTRWAVCSPGMDADVLMFNTRTATTSTNKNNETFIAEDLIIQSILMGDGTTVNKVITPPGSTKSQLGSMLPFKNHQEDEISRNEIATASFAEWIQNSSTTSSGKLSGDILRMCLLESFGGGGSASPSHSFHFGDARHAAAVRKRLSLSAAITSPAGGQPIVVSIVRALCAFAGGVGDAMSDCYRMVDKNGQPLRSKKNAAELWKLPPGSLNAVEFAIIAAARFVVLNSVTTDKNGRAVANPSKRNERLSLLLPCVLQSAYKLTCGINDYAVATANMYEVNLSTYATSGKNDGVECFIAAKCPELLPVISACNNSAKMVMKTLLDSGDRSLEDVLLRRKWKGDIQQWLVELNCNNTSRPLARITN